MTEYFHTTVNLAEVDVDLLLTESEIKRARHGLLIVLLESVLF